MSPSPTPDTPEPATDADGDGSASLEDCNDHDPSIHPGAPEHCDSTDNNCDGEIDEGAGTWFADLDENGFGSEEDARCTPATGYVEARGDCNDTDASVHPGANDPPTDGVDRDCGGTDAAQPHVGLSAESTTSIQTALDAASAGETVWVGPGTYPEQDLSFHGMGSRLISTHAASATVIESSGGRVFEFTDGEGPDTVLDGFTLTAPTPAVPPRAGCCAR